MNAISSFLAIALYVAASGLQVRDIRHGLPRRPIVLALGFAAVAAHTVATITGIATPQGMNLSVLQASSLIAWLICAITLFSSLRRPLENLLVALLPVAALTLLLTLLLDRPQEFHPHGPGMISHILLSILAYSVLSIAAVQAIALALQEYRLKHHQLRGLLKVLPPLQTMEQMLFELIWVGFALLTLSIASGALYVEDLLAQHLVHKTVFSIAAWVLFAILLWGRHQLGWRSRTAIRWTLTAFGCLLIAYIGTKIVLELILHKV